MENFETFKKKATSEEIADVYNNAPEQQIAADKQSAERFLLSRYLRPKTERQEKVASDVLNAEQAYKNFQEEIQSEAEEYVAAYGEYKTRLATLAAAQGVDAKPASMNAFISKMDAVSNLYDGLKGADEMHTMSMTKEAADKYMAERAEHYRLGTFFGSPEGKESRINAAVLNELFTQEIPTGTLVKEQFERNEYDLENHAPFYVPRPGVDRGTAIKQARERGSTLVLKAKSHFKLDDKGQVLYYPDTRNTSYTVLSEEVRKVLENGTLPYDLGDIDNDEAVFGTYRGIEPYFDIKEINELEKEHAPIQVTVNVFLDSIRVSDPDVRDVLRQISDAAERASRHSVAELQKLRVRLPDGRELGITEISEETLESARVETKEVA